MIDRALIRDNYQKITIKISVALMQASGQWSIFATSYDNTVNSIQFIIIKSVN